MADIRMDPLEVRGTKETEVAQRRRARMLVEVVAMDIIIPALIAVGLSLLVIVVAMKESSRQSRLEEKESPCDSCPYWTECQGKDKSDCLLYKTEEDLYG